MRTFVILLSILIVSICNAQTDSMIVTFADGTVRSYSVPLIQQLGFSGSVTSVRERELIQTALASFVLHQNYPNPFNPSTTLSYEIPHPGTVTLEVYDIQGRLVRSMNRSEQQAGFHAFVWDGRGGDGKTLSSGTYLCRVMFDGSFLTTKLSLIK
jgi:hypothetical protein